MTTVVGAWPPAPPAGLLGALARISLPTLGHYLEEGFTDPALARAAGSGTFVGRAITVRTTATDSTMLHHAAGLVTPGDVLVLDTGGDQRHAALGLVVATALYHRGAAGAVIDGPITDIEELVALGLPVHARGRSALTTKLVGMRAGSLNEPIVCGGVAVLPGDVVIGDPNGVLFASPHRIAAILDEAMAEERDEEELLTAVREGGRLGELTGASAVIERAIVEAKDGET